MLSDTDSIKICYYHSLIECTTHDEDKNAINLKFIVSCKNIGRLFPNHFQDTIMLFSFFLEGRSLPLKFGSSSEVIYSFIQLFIVFETTKLIESRADMNIMD